MVSRSEMTPLSSIGIAIIRLGSVSMVSKTHPENGGVNAKNTSPVPCRKGDSGDGGDGGGDGSSSASTIRVVLGSRLNLCFRTPAFSATGADRAADRGAADFVLLRVVAGIVQHLILHLCTFKTPIIIVILIKVKH